LTEELNDEVQSFEELLFLIAFIPHPCRGKRGLVKFIGYAMIYLFGAMDHHNMLQINPYIINKKGITTDYLHLQEEQLPYLNTLDVQVAENSNTVVNMARALNDFMFTTLQNIGSRENNIFLFSALIRNLEVAILQTRDDLLQLQESLDMTSMGNLSTTFIPPHNLTQILKQVSM
jgi:hypothetical protein